MTTVEQPQDPRVHVLPPEEARRRAHPLPGHAQLVVHDVPEEEWIAFHQALAER